MIKAKLNLIIDALLLLCLAAIGGIGLLINYVLVPGFQRWEIYGRNVDLFFWGMDRHEWGAIHYVLARVLLGLLVLHVVLHWKTIVSICRKLIPSRPVRWIAAAVLAGLTIFLLGFSVFVRPEVREGGRGEGRGEHQPRMRRHQVQRYQEPPYPLQTEAHRSKLIPGSEHEANPLPEKSGLNELKENDDGERTDETAISGSGRRLGRGWGRQCGDCCRRRQENQAQ
ncbi:MAG: DUF4405 domain-containing protein [Phycisphaerae bacterium]|nr:DUF4405 domain-containing protein [Phycisphaerae bacterium]